MKYIKLTLIFLLVSPVLFSKTIYFSSSHGNDNYTWAQAQSPNTPWRTIDKVNRALYYMSPGDSILFLRGDVFEGQVNLTCSGTVDNRITFSAYGDGPAPKIVGSIPVLDWSYNGSNIWKANVNEVENTISNLFISSIPQQIGRFPNSDDPNGGFLEIESHTGDIQLSSSGLIGSNSWTGGEAVIRTNHWYIDRRTILSHNDQIINLASPTTVDMRDGYGFFIQNHILTLDRDGEWYYNSETKEVFLFSRENPSQMEISISATKNCIEAKNIENIGIEFIEFHGCVESALEFGYCKNILISHCSFSDIGKNGLDFQYSNNVQISDNEISNVNNNGVYFLRCNSTIFNNNWLHNIGIRTGMAPNASIQSTGIYIYGNNNRCINNRLDSIGYVGINFHGDSVLIKNNLINNFCLVKDDGGGIYTSGDERITNIDRIVEGNIVLNGIGAPLGTKVVDSITLAHGIYMDARTNNVEIVDNSVAHCGGFGLYIHNSNKISILTNTFFDNYYQASFIYDNSFPNSTIRNCTVQDNIFFSTERSPYIINFRTVADDIVDFGLFDFNYYCRPLPDDRVFLLEYKKESNRVSESISLNQWQETYDKDHNSKIYPFKFPYHTEVQYLGENEFTNGKFDQNILGWTCWSENSNCDLTWASNKLDGGSMKIIFPKSISGSDAKSANLYGRYGETVRDEHYALNFTMVSTSSEEREISIVLREGTSPYLRISPQQFVNVSDSRKDFQIVFTPNSTKSISNIEFDFQQDETEYWIDNVELFRSNVQFTKVKDSILFLYNPSSENFQYDSNDLFIDPRGNGIYKPIIGPYKSLLLKKVSNDFFNSQYPDKNDILLLAYPNSSSTILNILTNDSSEKSIQIFDASGKLILNLESVSDTSLVIDISNFSKGPYILKMKGQRGAVSSSFIVS